MSNRSRDESGRFAEQVSEQDILKLFDGSDDPFLTAPEIAERFEVTPQAITYRLKRMGEKDLVDRKDAGSNAVGWWATVAPAPSAETLDDIEATEGELEHGETTSQAEMKRRLGIDGSG